MMLDHLGHPAAAAEMLTAIETSLDSTATKTRDLGGVATTIHATEAILTALAESPLHVGGERRG
jgi:tartrate dehydrogenase/decarboxylase/D-malate dehydrogenase